MLPGELYPFTVQFSNGEEIEITLIAKDFRGGEEVYEHDDHDHGQDHDEQEHSH